MTVEITSFRAKGDDEIAVTFKTSEGDNVCFDTFVISNGRFVSMRLTKGLSSSDVYDSVAHYEKVHSACKRALLALSYGICSRKKLISKLRMKGISSDIAEEAVAEIERKGYLDDAASAAREAERCVAKKWGARRISAALYQKGYDGEAVKRALYALEDSGVDFAENCAELIRAKWGELPDDPNERGKLYASMMRYGYSSSEINSAMDILKNDNE